MGFDFGKLVENVSQVRLKGGICKTSTWATIITVVCITIMAVSSGEVWLNCLSILLVAGFVLSTMFCLLDFAKKHPQAAILDGAEFLYYECPKRCGLG
jgi:hypothetical protein